MSILIKGMEMPENCYDCPFVRASWGNDYYCAKGNGTEDNIRVLMSKRMDDCPLIEVPTPHGRLADLDQIIDEFWDGYYMRIGARDLEEISSKTVIEAED